VQSRGSLISWWGSLTGRTVIQLHRSSENIRAFCVIQICDLSARMIHGLALCVQQCILSSVKLLAVPGASASTVDGIYYCSKFTLEQATKAQRESRGIVLLFL
jgi:hypothetical protein